MHEVRGALSKGSIKAISYHFIHFFKKEKINVEPFKYLILQNNKKGVIVVLNNFFNFIILQNLLEFNKFL
jgi:hypothetical protein